MGSAPSRQLGKGSLVSRWKKECGHGENIVSVCICLHNSVASIFAVQTWWQSSSDRILVSVSTLFYSIEKLQLVVNAEVLLGLSFF